MMRCAQGLLGACLLGGCSLRSSFIHSDNQARVAVHGMSLGVSGPYEHENLALYLVHAANSDPGRAFKTLEAALNEKLAVVYETGDVNELSIENLSDHDVFLQSGDVLRGGKQDRAIAMDFVAHARSGRMPISAFCVERGRWRSRLSDISGDGVFATANSIGLNNVMRSALNSGDQSMVWENVEADQARLNNAAGVELRDPESPTSLQLTYENDALTTHVNAVVDELEHRMRRAEEATGLIVAINGKLYSADVYSSRHLFAGMRRKLVAGAATDAWVKRQGADAAAPAPSRDVVVRFLNPPAGMEERGEHESSPGIVTRTRRLGDLTVCETYDRRAQGAFIHASYIICPVDAPILQEHPDGAFQHGGSFNLNPIPPSQSEQVVD